MTAPLSYLNILNTIVYHNFHLNLSYALDNKEGLPRQLRDLELIMLHAMKRIGNKLIMFHAMKRIGNKAKLNTTRSGIRKRQRLKSGAGIAIRACL